MLGPARIARDDHTLVGFWARQRNVARRDEPRGVDVVDGATEVGLEWVVVGECSECSEFMRVVRSGWN